MSQPKRQSENEFDLNEQNENIEPKRGATDSEMPIEDSMFSIEPLENDEIMINPKKSNYDPAKEESRKQKTRKLLGVLGGLVIVVVLVLAVLWASERVNETKQRNMTPTPPTASATAAEETKQLEELEMTAMQREYPNAPKVESGQTTIKVENNTITTSNGNSIILPETFKMGKTNNECDMKMNTDFCLIANGTYGESEQPNIDIYYFKDLVHTKLFEEPEKFELFDKEGSPVSAHTTLKIGEKSIPAATIALEDSSGWVITQSDTEGKVNIDILNGTTLKKQ